MHGGAISDLGEGSPRAGSFRWQTALVSFLVWAAVSGLSGCGSGSAVLRNLPTSATGTFFIKQKVLPDAVLQRSYTAYINTKGGSGQVSSCKLAGDSAGLSAIQQPITINHQSAPTFCELKTGAMTAPPGPHTFNLTATDTQGNNVTATFTVNVRPEFVFSQRSLDDGVTGRTYGQAKAGFTQPVTTTLGQSDAGNAPLTSCAMTVAGGANPGLLNPLPINQVTSTGPAQCQLQSLNNTPLTIPGSMAMTYQLTISGTDSSIEDKDPDVSAANLSPQAVPQHTASTVLNLTVNPAVSFAPNSIVVSGTAMDAVNGRTYGAGSLASNSTKTSLTYTATGGLLPTAGLKFSPSGGGSSLALPRPITCPALNTVQVGTAVLVCGSGNQAVSDAPGVFTFGLTVGDAGNAATPAGSTSSDTTGISQYKLNLDPPLANQLTQVTSTSAPPTTATNPSSLLDAVMSRSYGVIGGTPTYTASGGLGPNAVGGGGYIWCLSQGSLPGGFTGISNGSTCSTATKPAPTTPGSAITLQATDVAAAASSPPAPITFTVLLDDTGNAAVPSGAAASTTAPNTTDIIIRGPLLATLTQQQAAGAPPVTNPANLLDGGLNRSYGVINNAQGAPLFSASGGLGLSSVGGSAYRWCLKSGSLPVNVSLTASSGSPVTSTCAVGEAATGSTVTLQSTGVVSTGTFTPLLQLDDGGNAAVPSSFTYDASSAPATSAPTNLLIHPAITTVTTNDSASQDAAAGRSYGSNPAFPTLQDLTYTVPTVGGVAQGVSTVTLSPVGLPTGLACAEPSPLPTPAQPQINCNSGSKPLPTTVAPAGSSQAYSITVTVSDSGNFATAPASPSTDSGLTKPDTLTAYGSLQASLSQATNPTPSTWFAGVGLRTYGIPAAAPTIGAPPTYAASGGLGGTGASSYVWCLSPQSGPLPGGLGSVSSICGTTSTTKGASIALSSGTGTLADVSAVTTYSNVKIQLDDTGDLAVPDSLSAGVSATSSPASITVNPHLAVTGPSAFAAGVASRDYGLAADTCAGSLPCSPPVFQATNGLGSYTFLPPSSAGFPAGFNCTLQVTGLSGSDTCSAAPVTGSAKTYSVQMTVSDPGNPAVPNQTLGYTLASLTIGSEMTVIQPGAVPAAVLSRRYGTGSGCAGGNCMPLTYTVPPATPGLGGYTFTPNNFPSGFACATSSNSGNCSASSVGGSAGTFSNLDVTVKDTANQSTPSGSVTSSPNTTLTVDAEMTLTPPSTVLAAVVGRRYGTGLGCSGGACVPLSYTVPSATPGLGGYTFAPNNFPSGFTCATSSNNGNCSAGAVGGSAGTFNNLSVTVTDAPNQSTPSGSVTSSPNTTLTVDAEMMVTPPSTVPPAVLGRPYGTGLGCSGGGCVSLTYTVPPATPGLGGYTFTANHFPAGFGCATSSNSTNCSAGSVGGAAGTFNNLSVTVTDAPNQSTPSGSVTSSPNTTMTVDAEMTATPPSTVPSAVIGRRYGTGAGCSGGNCVALTYTVPPATPGLGGYTFTPNNFPLGFTCATSSNNGNCSDGSVGGSAGTLNNLNVTVKDTANQSTPSGSVTSSPNTTLTVDAEMTATPPSTVPPAVIGRRYGTGAGCSGGSCVALTYTVPPATPGLGGYAFTPNNFPSGFTCATSSNNGNCSDGSVGGSAGMLNNLNVTVKDTANQSTPGGSVTSSPNTTLTVDAEMTVTPPGVVPAAVIGRRYGTGSGCSGGSCVALTYTVPPATPGLGGYTFTPTNFPAGFSCATSSNNGNCSDGSVGGSAGTLNNLNVTVKDTANQSTPSGSVASSPNTTLTVDATLAVPAPAPFPVPDAVNGRTYGTGSGCSGGACVPLAYGPTGGLTPYQITGSGFPAGITCTQSGNTLNCSSLSGVTGSSSAGSVSVTDTANASSPSGSANRSPSDTITVEGALAITNTTTNLPPPNALLEFPYSFTFAATAGLPGADTWVAPGATGGACTTKPTGTLPPSLNLNSATGELSGTPTAASAKDSDFTFQICVADTANAVTPAGFALPNTTGQTFTVNALDTFAYVADPGLNQVEVINTGTPTVSPSNTVVTTLAATSPDSVAITPNGRQAFITLSSSKEFGVVDTILNSLVETFSLNSTCTSPAGVAITPDGTQAYVACGSGNELDVVDTSSDTVTSTILFTSGTPTAIAFKPDGSRAYVTLSTTNELAIVDVATATQISGSPFALSAANDTPLGIATTTNGSKVYAYIAKQNPTGAGAVDVVDVTTDPTTTLTIVTNITVGTSGSKPENLALTTESPDPMRVYVTLNGTSQFAILDNSKSAPALTGIFALPDPATAAGDTAPTGIAIPPLSPLPTDGLRIFISQSDAFFHDVGIIDNTSSPVLDSVPSIDLGGGAKPNSIAAIAVPH